MTKYRKNGVPKISKRVRQKNLNDPAALRDLITTLWLYTGRYQETQLTTEQKELLYDALDELHEREAPNDPKLERWWRK